MTLRPLLMHNANVLLMFTELILNRLKVEPTHLPMHPIKSNRGLEPCCSFEST